MTNIFENNKTQKTVAQTNEIIKVDDNGEITNRTTETITKFYSASESSYVKSYRVNKKAVNALKKKTREILEELLDHTTYNENAIYLNKGIKVEVCNELGITYPTLNNALTELKMSQILLYIDTGLYIVNPYYFGLGEWAKLNKIRKKIIIRSETKKVNNKRVVKYNFDYSGIQEQYLNKIILQNGKPKKKKDPITKNSNNKVNLKTKLGNFMKIFKTKNSNIQP